jgi:site-specific DNA recombinase
MEAVLYARVSSDKQDVDLSISAQLKALREYATRKGYTVVREFVDSAESGRTAYRPQFREMISLARRSDRPFQIILIYKYSRFARSREDSIVYKALLKKSGVQLLSITEPLDDTAMGRLMQAIIECIDEFYSENLGEEVTRGMRESASRGFYLSAKPPYGLRAVKVADGGKQRTRLELHDTEAPVMRSSFQAVLNGKGLMERVKELAKEGTAGPSGKGWGKTTLRKMLANEIYTGTLVWGQNSKRKLPPVRVENAYPAIVTKEEFDRVQVLLAERSFKSAHPRRTSSPYLLSGVTACGHCGKAFVGQEAKSGKYAYYVCGTLLKKGKGSCPAHSYNVAKLDALILDKIRARILTSENLAELAQMVAEEMGSHSEEYTSELQSVHREMADTNRRLERLYDAVETGKIPLDDLAPRIREMKERADKLKVRNLELEGLLANQKAEPASRKDIAEFVIDLRRLLDAGSISERRTFIKSFVKQVRITGDEAKLTYTLPVLPQGKDDETVTVLDIVHRGGR